VSLAGELMKKFEPEIEALTLVPSDGGRFEVSINGTLLYSKLKTGRHAEIGEIAGLLEKFIH
jgi:selenoprotein W-related protein